MEKILHLPLKAKWYNIIESGEKKEEYREIKPYWFKRFVRCRNNAQIGRIRTSYFCIYPDELKKAIHYGELKLVNYDKVKLSYGYTKRTMVRDIESITIGRGKPEWGAEPNKLYFVIKI